MALIERSIETTTHGRYLFDAPAAGLPLLVGFHGYAETAEIEFERMRSIEGTEGWTVLSVQGLHSFYRRNYADVSANWMTRQNRELAIADNNRYVKTVIDKVAAECAVSQTVILTGFSQGVAMAFRAASNLGRPVRGVIALGGEIPPELDASALQRTSAVLLGRGSRDEWYTVQRLAADEQRLQEAGVEVQTFTFEAGHEWTPQFSEAAARFLNAIQV